MRSSWRSFGRDESGQGLTEFTLVLALFGALLVIAEKAGQEVIDSVQGFVGRLAANHNESLLIDE